MASKFENVWINEGLHWRRIQFWQSLPFISALGWRMIPLLLEWNVMHSRLEFNARMVPWPRLVSGILIDRLRLQYSIYVHYISISRSHSRINEFCPFYEGTCNGLRKIIYSMNRRHSFIQLSSVLWNQFSSSMVLLPTLVFDV